MGTPQKKFQLAQTLETPQHLSQHFHLRRKICSLQILAEVLGCLPPLNKLKIFLGGPTNIYFHLKKVLGEDIELLNSHKSGEITFDLSHF